jgi:hypothetical protein
MRTKFKNSVELTVPDGLDFWDGKVTFPISKSYAGDRVPEKLLGVKGDGLI